MTCAIKRNTCQMSTRPTRHTATASIILLIKKKLGMKRIFRPALILRSEYSYPNAFLNFLFLSLLKFLTSLTIKAIGSTMAKVRKMMQKADIAFKPEVS